MVDVKLKYVAQVFQKLVGREEKICETRGLFAETCKINCGHDYSRGTAPLCPYKKLIRFGEINFLLGLFAADDALAFAFGLVERDVARRGFCIFFYLGFTFL